MKLILGDYIKIVIGEGITFWIGEKVNLFWETFLVEEMSKCLAIGWDTFPIFRVSRKDLGGKFTCENLLGY